MIKSVKDAVKIPVIGNGDITDGRSAKRMLERTGCDGIMIGRAAQGNPWIFREVAAYLEDGTVLPPPSADERRETAMNHLELLVKLKGERRGVLEARKHMSRYFKGTVGGAALRERINRAETPDEMRQIIERGTKNDE